MQATRREILNILKKNGRASVDELGKQLELTSMCIRQHLAILERDGLVVSQEQRQKLGRPRLVYSLTKQAENFFPKGYHQLLEWMLDEVKALDGREKAHTLYDRVAERMARQLLQVVSDKPLRDRVAHVCDAMNEEGSLAEWKETEDGYLLYEHNCRYHNVAVKHPDLCKIEMGVLTRVFDADVKMVECLLHDSTRCSYAIRRRPVG